MPQDPNVVPIVEINLDHQRHLVYDFLALSAIEKELNKTLANGSGKPREAVSVFATAAKLDGDGKPVLVNGSPVQESVFWKDISATKLLVVLWAGLLDEDPDITLDQVKKLLRRRDPAPIIKKIMEAWGLASPDPSMDAEDPTKGPSQESLPPGSTSGPSPVTTSASVNANSGS